MTETRPILKYNIDVCKKHDMILIFSGKTKGCPKCRREKKVKKSE